MAGMTQQQADLQALMREMEALRAEINRRPMLRWAYVVDDDPLTIRFEDETQPVLGVPSTLMDTHIIGQRVRCAVQLGGVTILGPAHGEGVGGPTGTLAPYVSLTPPPGWLMADGGLADTAGYPDLYAVIGTTFGPLVGSMFRLPNIRGRAVVGYNPADAEFDTIGETFGTKTHSLTAAQNGPHGHNFLYSGSQYGSLPYTIAIPGTGALAFAAGTPASANQISIANSGTGQAHNNIQPSIALPWIIKT